MRITTPKANHAEILARIAREVVEQHRAQPKAVTERFPDDGYQGLIAPMTVPGDYVLPERFQEVKS